MHKTVAVELATVRRATTALERRYVAGSLLFRTKLLLGDVGCRRYTPQNAEIASREANINLAVHPKRYS